MNRSELVEERVDRQGTRRTFLKMAAATLGAASSCSPSSQAGFFQDHYKELTPEEKEEVFARLEAETYERTGVQVDIKDPQPMDGVEFAFAINLSKCNGNRRCVYACMAENNQSRDPQIQYIRVLEIDKGSLEVEHSDMYYDPEKVPAEGKFYLPVQCQQCANPPCVKACPVEATWKDRDGIVVIDPNWCIGCRFCQAACPYDARRFNFTDPSIPPDEINPDQGYLSNAIRPRGVVEKCHFCMHRTRLGRYPACLEACPTGARKFGNLLDPEGEIASVIRDKRVFILKEHLGTHPRIFYYFD